MKKINAEEEKQLRCFARGARWKELTDYLLNHIEGAQKLPQFELLVQSGIKDDEKRRIVTRWLIDSNNKRDLFY